MVLRAIRTILDALLLVRVLHPQATGRNAHVCLVCGKPQRGRTHVSRGTHYVAVLFDRSSAALLTWRDTAVSSSARQVAKRAHAPTATNFLVYPAHSHARSILELGAVRALGDALLISCDLIDDPALAVLDAKALVLQRQLEFALANIV